MTWNKKVSSSGGKENTIGHTSSEEDRVEICKTKVRLKASSNPAPISSLADTPEIEPVKRKSRKLKQSTNTIKTEWDAQGRITGQGMRPTGLGIEEGCNHPEPGSIQMDAMDAMDTMEARVSEMRGHKNLERTAAAAARVNQCEGLCCEKRSDQLESTEKEARRAERKRKRQENRAKALKENTEEPKMSKNDTETVEGSSSMRQRRRERDTDKHTRIVASREERREKVEAILSKTEHTHAVRDTNKAFLKCVSDCRRALRHAERQRENVLNIVRKHRLEKFQQAIIRRNKERATGINEEEFSEESTQTPTTVNTEEAAQKVQARAAQKRSNARRLERRVARETDRAAQERALAERHSERIRARRERRERLESERRQLIEEYSRQLQTIEAEFSAAQEQAIRHVRAAESDRQRVLLVSPQDIHHARIRPPPRDEYSTVDEDIPPYRAQLHKYLDLMSYDERFTPILRVNCHLINGDTELNAAIDKFTHFNLLPQKTDLWLISHVDDNEYEEMIPYLIPQHSY